MIIANTEEEVFILLRNKSDQYFAQMLDKMGYDEVSLEILTIDELKQKLEKLDNILEDPEKKGFPITSYNRDKDYKLPADVEPSTVGYGFSATTAILERKKKIIDFIKSKTNSQKIESLKDLVSNVADKDLKDRLNSELNDLVEQSKNIEKEEKEIDKQKSEYSPIQQQLQITKTKLDLFEKKSQIWLKILAKESIASIVGAFLLVAISLTQIVAMFVKIPSTEIINSSFLLILGYFFGQAAQKK